MGFFGARWRDFSTGIGNYPRAFNVLWVGSFVKAFGMATVWPFLSVYLRENLAIMLATVAMLWTIMQTAGMIGTPLLGILVDRFGRKKMIVLGFGGGGLIFLAHDLGRNDMAKSFADLSASLCHSASKGLESEVDRCREAHGVAETIRALLRI